MISLRQTPRSLAVQSLLVLALVGATGCSNSDTAAFEYGYANGGSQSTGATSSGGGGGGSESGDSGTDTGDPDSGGTTMPAPEPVDPDLTLDACNALAEQVFSYPLVQANAEAESVLVRERVLAGDGSVPAIPLSARPFLNHYAFGYPAAESWDPQISGELWQPPMVNVDAPDRYLLQYAIRGPAMTDDERPPIDLAIVVDLASIMGSIMGPVMDEPLALAEEALAAIESSLMPGDRVSLIAAGVEPIELGTTLIDNFGLTPLTGLLGQQELVALADVQSAVELAYATISDGWNGQAPARVLLISNGYFEPGSLAASIDAHAADGQLLLSLGVGEPEQFDALLLGSLAAEGRGAMLFASNADEVWLALEQQFTQRMIAAATDLQVMLSLPAGLGLRMIEPIDPSGGEPLEPKLAVLGPNHALVFHHELEACGELSPDAEIRVEIAWTDPVANEAKQAVWQQPVAELGSGSLYGHKGAATIAYARALRAFRDGNATGSYAAVLDAISQISDALAGLPEDPDLLEMSAVLAELSTD